MFDSSDRKTLKIKMKVMKGSSLRLTLTDESHKSEYLS